MIEIETNTIYKLSLTDHQVRQLYNLLLRQNNIGQLKFDTQLIPVLDELRKLFPGSQVIKEEYNRENLPYFVDN